MDGRLTLIIEKNLVLTQLSRTDGRTDHNLRKTLFLKRTEYIILSNKGEILHWDYNNLDSILTFPCIPELNIYKILFRTSLTDFCQLELSPWTIAAVSLAVIVCIFAAIMAVFYAMYSDSIQIWIYSKEWLR